MYKLLVEWNMLWNNHARKRCYSMGYHVNGLTISPTFWFWGGTEVIEAPNVSFNRIFHDGLVINVGTSNRVLPSNMGPAWNSTNECWWWLGPKNGENMEHLNWGVDPTRIGQIDQQTCDLGHQKTWGNLLQQDTEFQDWRYEEATYGNRTRIRRIDNNLVVHQGR